ncbi:MAG: hypothetical protein EBR83_08385, partial [Verrucomicrobia bacterium]|nr:hypothetical protein [Verrucomicrobiota bacterium]
GTGIPAGATVLSVDSPTQFTLNVPATSTTSGQTIVVAATAIGSKVVTLASTSGLQTGMSISAPGVYPGSVIVSIDSANRITMDRASYTDAIAATNFQFGTTYSETVGSIAGGNRQTNANWAYINLGVGTTLNINETTASTFVGEFAGLGAVRLAGNATLTLTNTHNSFGNLIIDRGALWLGTGTSARLYASLPAGNVPDIIVNRYGALYLDKAYSSGGGVDQINNIVALHLNSAAGTMLGLAVTGDKYPETRPMGVWNRGNQAATGVETIMGFYFDSGTNYVGGYASGSMSQGFQTSTGTLLRNNFATTNLRGRYYGTKGTGGSDSIYQLGIGDAAYRTAFNNALLGGGTTLQSAQMGTTLNSNTVTWATSPTGIAAGMGIQGVNILPSTTLTATAAGSFTISQVSTATSTANWINIYAATPTTSIVPWMIGETWTAANDLSETNMGNSLITYDLVSNSLRVLDLTYEYGTFAQKQANAPASTTWNIRESLIADLTGLTSGGINALVLHNNTSTASDFTVSGSGALSVNAGAILFTLNPFATPSSASSTRLSGFSGLVLDGTGTLGASEYVITVVNPTSTAISPKLTAIIDSPLSTSANLTKSGRGTLVLTATNVAGGGATKQTTINEGILRISSLANIGGTTGNLVFAGGTLQLADAFAQTDLSTRTFQFMSAGGTLDVGTNNLTFAGPIGGQAGVSVGGFTKAGSASLVLGGTAVSTYLGSTSVTNGRLVLAGGLTGGADNRLNTATTLNLGVADTNGVLQLGNGSGAMNQSVSALTSLTGLTSADILTLVGGSGYATAPILNINADGGMLGSTPAQARATVSGGAITGITVTDAGLYLPGSTPTVTVNIPAFPTGALQRVYLRGVTTTAGSTTVNVEAGAAGIVISGATTV